MYLPWPIHFNYKVHALNTLEGFITSFEITPASIYEREGFSNLLAGHCAITLFGIEVKYPNVTKDSSIVCNRK